MYNVTKEQEEKREFVAKLGDLLRMAKPHLIKCEFSVTEIGEYVIVTAENGYQYKINVTADSKIAIAEDVFTKMFCK